MILVGPCQLRTFYDMNHTEGKETGHLESMMVLTPCWVIVHLQKNME